mgnify:CR=1 FL=1
MLGHLMIHVFVMAQDLNGPLLMKLECHHVAILKSIENVVLICYQMYPPTMSLTCDII